jgi:DNA replication protein DnaC
MTSNVLLNDYLKRLRLPTIAKNYERLSSEAVTNNANYLEYLLCLLEQEVQTREESTKKERISHAKFPALKTLDSFKFEEVPALNKNLVLALFRGQYIQQTENIVFLGGHGTGKTHLAIALGIQACNAGKRVRYFTVADLVHQLLEAREEKQVLRYQQQLGRYDLLVLDELGMIDCPQDGSNLLFQVISSRYERRSTIITTNLEFKDWPSVFGTQKLTSALLDRLIHRCHILEVNGESYRFKESLRRKKNNKEAA